MAISFADIMAELDKEEVATPSFSGVVETPGVATAYQATWDKLFGEKHPAGGGAYGGQNNALVRFIALLKARRTPILAALAFAESWNDKQCVPPMPAELFHHTFQKVWKNFAAGSVEILDESLVAGEWEVLDVNQLLNIADNSEGIPWLVPGFIKEAGLHIIAAPAAGAKSWIMMELARCFLTGTQYFGRDVQQRPVFYIDEEMGSTLYADRIKKLGFDRSVGGMSYIGRQGFVITNPKHLQRLVEWCNQNPGGVVFADTLVAISDMDENSNSEVRKLRPLFNSVMNTGATLIVAHHVKKGGGTVVEHEVLRGAADLAAMVDMAYVLNKQEGFTKLKVVKNRLTSEEEGINIDFKLEDYYPDGMNKRVRLVQLGHEARNTETLERQIQAVLDSLSTKSWKSIEEIVEISELSSGEVRTTLLHLQTQNVVDGKKRNGIGVFQILSDEPEDQEPPAALVKPKGTVEALDEFYGYGEKKQEQVNE